MTETLRVVRPNVSISRALERHAFCGAEARRLHAVLGGFPLLPFFTLRATSFAIQGVKGLVWSI
jgi:hypothetical protein